MSDRTSGGVVEARVEELVTPGLEETPIHRRAPDESPPLKWEVDAGFLSLFSETFWAVGYGSWSVYTEPSIVAGVVALAAAFAESLSSMDRYYAVLGYLQSHRPPREPLPVFPDS